MFKMPRHFWSLLIIPIFAISANMLLNDRKTADKAHTLFHHDQAGYTAYLPAIFIYHDLSFSFYDEQPYFRFKEFLNPNLDVPLNKYSVGPAILLSPFFAIGHWRATSSEVYPADGFSKPYKHSMLMGSLFYACLGLLLLRSLLLRYFGDSVVALTLLALGLGTNLIYYSSLEGLMSHVFSFFLFAASLYCWLRWLDGEKAGWLLLTGLAAGLILATRLPNGLFFLVLIGWGVLGKDGLNARLALLWRHKWVLLGAIGLALVALFPQFYYWKLQTGHWIVDHYTGERFFWEQPLVGKILFSYRSGWLVYTPLMSLSVVGLFFLGRYCPAGKWMIPLYFGLHLYLISCWGTWWFGGSFGMRTMVEAYLPLAFALAACLNWIIEYRWTRYVFIALFPVFITVNLVQVHQYSRGIIHHDGMTAAAYWAVFMHTDPVSKEVLEKRTAALNHPNYAKANRNKPYRKQLP